MMHPLGKSLSLNKFGRLSGAVVAVVMLVSAPCLAQTSPPPNTSAATKPLTNREVLQQDFNFQLRNMPIALQKRLRGLQAYCQERASEINVVENFVIFTDLDSDKKPEMLLNLTNACITPGLWFCEDDGSCQFEVWATPDMTAWRRVLVKNVFGVTTSVDGTNINLRLMLSTKDCTRAGFSDGRCMSLARMKSGTVLLDKPKALPVERQ